MDDAREESSLLMLQGLLSKYGYLPDTRYGHYLLLVRKNTAFYAVMLTSCLIGFLCIIPKVTVSSSIALFNSTIITLLVLIRIVALKHSNSKFAFTYNIILIFSLAVTILPFFLAISDAVLHTHRRLVDAWLISIDELLLGWLYPRGQVSLALDASSLLNPSTPIGQYCIEIFELFYLSYYIWGYLCLILLVRRYAISWRARRNVETSISLVHVKMYLCTWLCAYYLTFILNYIFPASSPRIYLKDQYKHPLGNSAFVNFMSRITSDDMSFGSFPSGHFSETLVVGIFTLRSNRNLGVLILVFAFLIAISTQILRYHYFIDLIGASLVCIFSIRISSCITKSQFNDQVYDMMGMLVLQSIIDQTECDCSEVVNAEQATLELTDALNEDDNGCDDVIVANNEGQYPVNLRASIII